MPPFGSKDEAPDAPLDPNAGTEDAPVTDAAPASTDTTPADVAVVDTQSATEEDDTIDLALVSPFGQGDTFTYHHGEDVYIVGTNPVPVPAAVADALVESARNVGVQIVDTSKEG